MKFGFWIKMNDRKREGEREREGGKKGGKKEKVQQIDNSFSLIPRLLQIYLLSSKHQNKSIFLELKDQLQCLSKTHFLGVRSVSPLSWRVFENGSPLTNHLLVILDGTLSNLDSPEKSKNVKFLHVVKIVPFLFDSRLSNLCFFNLTYLKLGSEVKAEMPSFPPNLTHLHLCHVSQWRTVSLPPHLQSLTLSGPFNLALDQLTRDCSQLTTLKLFYTEIDLRSLPAGLQTLQVFDRRTNHALTALPPSLRRATIEILDTDNTFSSVDLSSCPDLIQLTLKLESNQPFLLPLKLTHLTLGHQYNLPLPVLPSSLTHLTFGDKFDQPIDDLSNLSLTHLVFGKYFDQSVDHLPVTLLVLVLGASFRQSVSHLPPSLRRLDLSKSLTFVWTPHPLDHLPKSLTHLWLGNLSPSQTLDHLPVGLLHLSIGNHFNSRLDHLPPSLLTLSVGNHFNQPVDHLPSTLRLFVYGTAFNQSLTRLPPQVTLRCLNSSLYFVPLS